MKTKSFIPFGSLFVLLLTSCSSQKFEPNLIEGTVDFHQTHQKAFLEDTNPSKVGTYAAYAPNENYANPLPIKISWKGPKDIQYDVAIREGIALTGWDYSITGNELDLYNCKINTTYNVTITPQSDKYEPATMSFTTNSTVLRNIYVDGVDNFRDLGGYSTEYGKKVMQSLVYRSAELNKNKETTLVELFSEDGKKTLVDQLKIKTEIDLRKVEESNGVKETSGITKSPISDDVKYVSAPMYYDGENMLEHSDQSKRATNLNSVKVFFETLADTNNYPVVFHCVQGKDRTGCLSYLLNALLGVSKADLYRDYLFTNFSKSVGSACKTDDIDRKYGATIEAYEGDNLMWKVYNYLNKEVGLSTQTLDAVKSILTY